MIKKRTRPQPRTREISPNKDEEPLSENEEETNLSFVSFQLFSVYQAELSLNEFSRLADLIELRKLRKARQGIDVAKLNKGDIKKKKKRPREEGEQGGLRKGVQDEEEYACHYKARRLKT